MLVIKSMKSTAALNMILRALSHIKHQLKITNRRICKHIKVARSKSRKYKTTEEWSLALQQLRKNGYCELPGSILTDEVVTTIGKMHTNRNVANNISLYKNIFRLNKMGHKKFPEFNQYGKLNHELDENIWSSFDNTFVEKLHLLLSEYYNQDYWVRNPPTLVLDASSYRREEYGQSFYHLDWAFHQLSLIVLLNTTATGSTCTRVIKGTNRLIHCLYEIPLVGSSRRYSIMTRYIAKLLEKLLGSVDLIGESGTCFVMDAGNTFHKAVYGEDRAMIHFNFAIDESYQSKSYLEKLPSQYLSKRSLLEIIPER